MSEPLFSKFNDLISQNPIFWFCALVGSGMFFIQFVLNFVGGDSDHYEDVGSSETDSGNFKWLSKQAIIGFLMMFGWTGLACIKEFELSRALCITIALSAGIITIFITGALFSGAKKLVSSGNVFKIENIIGKEATVYQRIPKNGIGKISISYQNLSYEIDAISLSNEELSSFVKVQVIKQSDNETAVVVPI